jgi:hypothetical protein
VNQFLDVYKAAATGGMQDFVVWHRTDPRFEQLTGISPIPFCQHEMSAMR